MPIWAIRPYRPSPCFKAWRFPGWATKKGVPPFGYLARPELRTVGCNCPELRIGVHNYAAIRDIGVRVREKKIFIVYMGEITTLFTLLLPVAVTFVHPIRLSLQSFPLVFPYR